MAKNDLKQLYDDAFFELWGAHNRDYVRSARTVADCLFEQYRPATVLDLGCGAGFHCARLIEHGVQVVAADWSACPLETRAPGLDHIETVDLGRPLPDDRFPQVDLVLCLDVAEHLPPEQSQAIVDNCTRFSDLVAFSAAPPGQGGVGHVNEQPRRYWFERFNKARFRHCRKESGWLDVRGLALRDVITLRWMITQVAIFRRGPRWPYPPMRCPGHPPTELLG